MKSRQTLGLKQAGARKEILRYGSLLLGSAIMAFGLYNIHKQSNITEGGVLGMTLFLNHWLGISPAISGFVMDVTCYLIGLKFLGKRFALYSLVASAGFATFYSIFERFPPLMPSMDGMPILAAILGGLFVGIGVGLAVRAGGASGGDDALAMVISHVSGWKISRAYLCTDLIVLAASLSYIPVGKIVCSLITVTISSFLIGYIQNFGKQKKVGLQGQEC